MTTLRILLVPAMSAAMFISCTREQNADERGDRSNAPPVVSVQLSPVRRGDIGDFVTATGRLDVLRRQKVLSPVAGTLLTLRVLEGGVVKRGDILATILPKESQAAIIGAEALLYSATTEAGRREAERAIALARETQNAVSVRAAFDGVIATRGVTEGELVTDGVELMTIVDLSTIIFVASRARRTACGPGIPVAAGRQISCDR
jgi:multidrug efflux pump subunit AcrA (membrane-fusion protein)